MSYEILKKYGIKAKKSLGQNFLIDESLLEKMLEPVEIFGKNIIEVGPGYGALTKKILTREPHSLSLIELDRDMIKVLKDRKENGDFGEGDFEIIYQDVLTYNPYISKYSILANIPYYITSPILRHFLYEVQNPPEQMLILMQKEVAEKILAGQPFEIDAGGNHKEKKEKNIKSSALSLLIQKKSSVQKIIDVPASSFSPSPKVSSSVVLFRIDDRYRDIDDKKFIDFLFMAFAQPRKTLKKNLSAGGIEVSKILQFFDIKNMDYAIRAEKLTLADFLDFYTFLYDTDTKNS